METKLKEMGLPWQLIFIKVEISEYIYNFYPFWEYIPRQQNWLARRWPNVGTTVLALGVCAGLSKWLCNQFGQSLQKHFLPKKIFLVEKKYISCREKYISCREKYFLRRKIFLAEKNISCGKNIFLAEKNLFIAEKNYFLRKKYISCEEKYISCGEKYISCGEIYFLRKNIFSTMLPISFRSTGWNSTSANFSATSVRLTTGPLESYSGNVSNQDTTSKQHHSRIEITTKTWLIICFQNKFNFFFLVFILVIPGAWSISKCEQVYFYFIYFFFF